MTEKTLIPPSPTEDDYVRQVASAEALQEGAQVEGLDGADVDGAAAIGDATVGRAAVDVTEGVGGQQATGHRGAAAR